MAAFLKHILKVALGVGLVMGLFLFSLLLYVSDFTKGQGTSETTPVAAVGSDDAPLTPAEPESFNKRFLTWIFGPVEEQTPPVEPKP